MTEQPHSAHSVPSAPPGADRMVVRAPARLRGTVAVPGDKSVTHRALILNAIAEGEARIEGYLDAADTRATLACLRALGADIEPAGDGALLVRGRGRGGLREPDDVLDCGNSGTTMRLLSGLLAGLPMMAVLTGDASLRQRPMARVVGPLTELGARVTARAAGTLPPVVVGGGERAALRGGARIETPVASAQVKSALLLAGLGAAGHTTVVEPSPSRDHTERMLGAMSARIDTAVTEDGRASVTLTPPLGELSAVDVRVPGDISTAAAWLVAATIHPDADLTLTGVGVNPTRTGLLDTLDAMGADIERLEERTIGGEPVADLHVRSARLRAVEVGGELVPRAIDELPLVALAAAMAEGETVIRDAAELRVKESDRVATTTAALRAFGVDIEERADGLRVRGKSGSGEGAPLRGASVRSEGDHRLAMLGAVAALVATGESSIGGATAVAVSYPEFWSELDRLGAIPAALPG